METPNKTILLYSCHTDHRTFIKNGKCLNCAVPIKSWEETYDVVCVNRHFELRSCLTSRMLSSYEISRIFFYPSSESYIGLVICVCSYRWRLTLKFIHRWFSQQSPIIFSWHSTVSGVCCAWEFLVKIHFWIIGFVFCWSKFILVISESLNFGKHHRRKNGKTGWRNIINWKSCVLNIYRLCVNPYQ